MLMSRHTYERAGRRALHSCACVVGEVSNPRVRRGSSARETEFSHPPTPCFCCPALDWVNQRSTWLYRIPPPLRCDQTGSTGDGVEPVRRLHPLRGVFPYIHPRAISAGRPSPWPTPLMERFRSMPRGVALGQGGWWCRKVR